jgi:hypothetical protein
MQYLQQILFILTLAIAIWLFSGKVKEISSNIRLGKDEDFSDHPGDRWKNVLLLAFGQKKMFRKPLVALLHFVIYAGFLIINIEVLEIILDGILGTHRLFCAVPRRFLYVSDQFLRILCTGCNYRLYNIPFAP